MDQIPPARYYLIEGSNGGYPIDDKYFSDWYEQVRCTHNCAVCMECAKKEIEFNNQNINEYGNLQETGSCPCFD